MQPLARLCLDVGGILPALRLPLQGLHLALGGGDVRAQLAELALPAALTDPLGAVRTLVGFALDAGGTDNVTAVLAPYPPAGPA